MKKKLIRIFCVFAALLMILPMAVSGVSYHTYTYSIDGNPLDSPHAYTANKQVDAAAMGLPNGEKFNMPKDLEVDDENNVYIVDSGNSCVYVLDSYYKFKFKISTFVNSNGVDDALSGCQGCYITKDYIYVADTANSRIVLFDRNGQYVRHFEAPEAEIFEDDAIYKPVALAVDASGRIYVVSSTTYQGILALNAEGEFQSFVGAQMVSISAWDLFWRQFQTARQRALSDKLLPTEYNNITIDESGFIYVTTSSIDPDDQQGAIYSKNGNYSPVKRFNASGSDILGRNGFFGPGGEVQVNNDTIKSNITGPSEIVDVALGPSGSWSIIDKKRSKIYTYDKFGQLLFIFGDKGQMLGNIQQMAAITYQDDKILVLDAATKNVTVYTRTEYGDILITALQNEIDRNYDAAVEDYENILQRNSNFDAAYIGIGKSLYRQGKYEESMKMFAAAYDTANYSKAFKEIRQQWANKYFVFIPIAVIVALFAIAKFFGYAAKVNKATSIKTGKRTFKEEILFAFHLIFHPFDGFWDLKHEKRGSVRGAIFYLVLAVIAVCYQSIGQAYIFNPRANYSSLFMSAISILAPVALWVIGNWCLTTLFDGEGSMKDIFISTCYSAVPLVLLIIPATALTNVLLQSEAAIYSLIVSFAWLWTGLLLFFGTMVTHDYPLVKNFITCIGTIVAMAFIMFCAALFSALLAKMVSFVTGIITEISYRM